jgi:prephenate dehydrogenase
MSRVAAMDEDLWTELLLMNSENLTRELELFIRNLAEYRDAVRIKDAEKLRALLREGRECKVAAAGGI